LTKNGVDGLSEKIGEFPRIRLTNLPTPLERMSNLSALMNGPTIWIKRDDCTGLAFGGSKVRALEFLMADVISKKCDYVLTTGEYFSNHVRLSAAASRKLGLNPVAVISGKKPRNSEGNFLLDQLLGTDIRFAASKKTEIAIERGTSELRRQGHATYILPEGGSSALGIVGYVNLALELQDQIDEMGINADYIVSASSSGGIQSGLTVGNAFLKTSTKVLGISVYKGLEARLREDLLNKSKDVSGILGIDTNLSPEDFLVTDYYSTDDFKFLYNAKAVKETILLVARTEGVFLEPLYTGKAMTVLLDMIRQKKIGKAKNVVFIHSGGIPALFGETMNHRSPPPPLMRLLKRAGLL
jgi:L-cysteate sulfo-lyase